MRCGFKVLPFGVPPPPQEPPTLVRSACAVGACACRSCVTR